LWRCPVLSNVENSLWNAVFSILILKTLPIFQTPKWILLHSWTLPNQLIWKWLVPPFSELLSFFIMHHIILPSLWPVLACPKIVSSCGDRGKRLWELVTFMGNYDIVNLNYSKLGHKIWIQDQFTSVGKSLWDLLFFFLMVLGFDLWVLCLHTLYHLSHGPNPFCFSLLLIGSRTFTQVAQTTILLPCL
jgi:hypothetical protein